MMRKIGVVLCLMLFAVACGDDGAGATKVQLKSETIPKLKSVAISSATINVDRARPDAPATISLDLDVSPGTGIRERGHLMLKSAVIYTGDQTMILSMVPDEDEEKVKPEVASAMATLKYESQNSRFIDETTLAFSSDTFKEKIVNNMTTNMPLDVLCASDTVTIEVVFDAAYISYLEDSTRRSTYEPFIVTPIQCSN